MAWPRAPGSGGGAPVGSARPRDPHPPPPVTFHPGPAGDNVFTPRRPVITFSPPAVRTRGPLGSPSAAQQAGTRPRNRAEHAMNRTQKQARNRAVQDRGTGREQGGTGDEQANRACAALLVTDSTGPSLGAFELTCVNPPVAFSRPSRAPCRGLCHGPSHCPCLDCSHLRPGHRYCQRSRCLTRQAAARSESR